MTLCSLQNIKPTKVCSLQNIKPTKVCSLQNLPIHDHSVYYKYTPRYHDCEPTYDEDDDDDYEPIDDYKLKRKKHQQCNGDIYGRVYRILFPNGEHYIGQTKNSLKKRRYQHARDARNKETEVYKAMRHYKMIDTFRLIPIAEAYSKDELDELESYHIRKYNSHYLDGGGYNMTRGNGLNR